mgnify:CR=1 FL=1
MPVMDGYEATQQIRQLIFDNYLCQPIIVAVTGHTEETYVNRALRSGMNQVLSKPIQVILLNDIISTLKFPISAKLRKS